MTDTMLAIAIPEPGGPDALKPSSVPIPQPAPDQILIRNMVAGVNRPDCAQRQGNYHPPADANPLPGLEVAGEVVAVGGETRRYKPGDHVTALTHGGGYAEYTAVHERHCLPWPKDYDAQLAGAIPENYFTVYYNVFTRSRLTSGETFLVHGGSSGIGLAAIQLAKASGATVITTAGTDEKCSFCESIGADKAVNYRTEDWPEIVREFTGRKKIDVVLDMVAGDYVQKNIDLLGRDGRYALIAFLGGSTAEVNFGRVMMNRLSISGSTLRPQSLDEKAQIAGDVERIVWPMFEKNKARPHIHCTFPLHQAAQAHRLMESSSHIGKILLTIE
ncbi:MAG TPA: NAD(P)H-quinone oxidoreductase [Gammaproteobacteria bacterium]|nr:NAD(P)H-quinone oxidoreductase [Gammaproteobacteria bacterium]